MYSTIPKVLIVSHNCFSDKRNNGKTLEALFSQFPKDSLAQLFFHINDTPDFEYCSRYYRITETDVIRSLLKGKRGIGKEEVYKQEEWQDNPSKKAGLHKLMYCISSLLGDWGRDMIWKVGSWKSDSLMSWIEDFEPEVIFFVGGRVRFSANIALRLSKCLGIPLVSYYTDDYLFSVSQNGFIGKHKYKRREKLIQKVIDNSSNQYVIGDYMAKEFSRHFSKPFNAIMNSVAIRPYQPYPNKDSLSITYFGGLHLNRWQMIARLSSMLPPNAHIDVYTSANSINDTINRCFMEKGINYRGSLSGQELVRAMTESDILLHVESDDEINRRFTRLAVSTKIPEYLMTGRPVLGFGPDEVASMKILSENKIGFVISSDEDDASIREKINTLIEDYTLRESLGKCGYDYATLHFDKERIASDFLKSIGAIVNSN